MDDEYLTFFEYFSKIIHHSLIQAGHQTINLMESDSADSVDFDFERSGSFDLKFIVMNKKYWKEIEKKIIDFQNT